MYILILRSSFLMLEFSAAALLACILMRPVHRIHKEYHPFSFASAGLFPVDLFDVPCFDEPGVSESGVYNTHGDFNTNKFDRPLVCSCFPIILSPEQLNLRPCTKCHS